MSVQNYQFRNQERGLTGRANERHGLVTSYDPKKHLAKVTFQPDGEESGWLPIEDGHMGNGWGILRGLSPGTGKGAQGQQGQGGPGGSNGGGGDGGGDQGGQGGGQQQGQYQGDQVTVAYHSGDLSSGRIVKSLHSKVDTPPQVEAGEMLFMHSLGGRLFFKKDGSLHLFGKTSKQDDQNQSGQQSGQQGGQSGGSGGGGSGGGSQGTPLKNAPPLQPQTYKMKIDPKGITTITHFQQQQGGQGGQGGGGQQGGSGGGDPVDPNSTQSPQDYSSMVTDPTKLSHTHTTYQEGQGQQSQSGGGGQAQPAKSQGDPGQDSKNNNQAKMFSQTVHDTKKGQLHHTTYDKQGKKKHQIIFDTQANKVTLQTFQEGGEQPEHQVLMDQGSGNLICQTCGGGGKQQAQIVLDKQGHITHTAQGQIKMHAQGGFKTTGKWSHQGGFEGDTVNASISMTAPMGSVPGPTPGTGGGQAGPIGSASFIGSGAKSSTS